MSRRIRVIVADSQKIVREGLRRWLKRTNIDTLAEVSTLAELLRVAHEDPPDVILSEVRLEDGESLAALTEFRQQFPKTAILFFSEFDNPIYISQAMKSEAAGYVLKTCTRDELLEAIKTVESGGNLWTVDELRRLQGAMAVPRMNGGGIEGVLTARESEILSKVAMGLTNKQVARFLKISPETVKEHVQHILQKVGVRDRTQAALWYVRQGNGE